MATVSLKFPGSSSNIKLGNENASSLAKSAASAATSWDNYQDQVEAANWDDGYKTDADYSAYKSYLSGRISTLNAAGDTASLSKALSLQQTGISVDASYRSNQIGLENIAIQEGNGTTQQKADLLKNLAEQAYADGDVANAQSLVSQYNTAQLSADNQATAAATKAASDASTASSNSYSMATHQLDTAQSVLDASLKSGTVPKESDGSPIVGADGKPITSRLTATDYGNLSAGILQAKQQLITSRMQATGDPTGEYQAALSSLQNSSTYQALLSPQAVAERQNGQTPFALKRDPETGVFSLVPLKTVSEGYSGVDQNGNLITKQGYESGLSGSSYTYNGAVYEPSDVGKGGETMPQQANVLTYNNKANKNDPANGLKYYIDNAGRQVFLGSDGVPHVVAGDPAHPNQAALNAAIAAAKGTIDSSVPGQSIASNIGTNAKDLGQGIAKVNNAIGLPAIARDIANPGQTLQNIKTQAPVVAGQVANVAKKVGGVVGKAASDLPGLVTNAENLPGVGDALKDTGLNAITNLAHLNLNKLGQNGVANNDILGRLGGGFGSLLQGAGNEINNVIHPSEVQAKVAALAAQAQQQMVQEQATAARAAAAQPLAPGQSALNYIQSPGLTSSTGQQVLKAVPGANAPTEDLINETTGFGAGIHL